jgi:hypothetical protein
LETGHRTPSALARILSGRKRAPRTVGPRYLR